MTLGFSSSSHFILDEKNKTTKEILMKRISGYMKRAEQLKTYQLEQEASAKAAKDGGNKKGGPQATATGGGASKEDKEK